MKDERGADQSEACARRDEGNQHSGHKARKDNERSTPGDSAHTG